MVWVHTPLLENHMEPENIWSFGWYLYVSFRVPRGQVCCSFQVILMLSPPRCAPIMALSGPTRNKGFISGSSCLLVGVSCEKNLVHTEGRFRFFIRPSWGTMMANNPLNKLLFLEVGGPWWPGRIHKEPGSTGPVLCQDSIVSLGASGLMKSLRKTVNRKLKTWKKRTPNRVNVWILEIWYSYGYIHIIEHHIYCIYISSTIWIKYLYIYIYIDKKMSHIISLSL